MNLETIIGGLIGFTMLGIFFAALYFVDTGEGR